MNTMKYARPAAIALAGFSLGTNAAFAGGMAEPIQMAPEQIEQETATASSGPNVLVPLILLAILTLALSNSGGTPATVITEGG